MNAFVELSGMMTEAFTGIKAENYKKAIENDMNNISLIVPMFAVYLVDYQDVFKQCLEPNARTFEKTSRTDTVYENGLGVEQYRIEGRTHYSYFKVNKRFVHVFEDVGLSNPDSSLGKMVDSMFSRNSRVDVSQIVNGTRKLMADNKSSCSSEKILTLENNMLQYFNAYQQGKLKTRDIMLGR
ncbi:MAG: hypothetical protein V1706_01795 [Pseudomonadota bacterium]